MKTIWLLALAWTLTGTAAAWELRRDDLNPKRPPIVDGTVTVQPGGETGFPRYLNELGVKTIRIPFEDTHPGKRTLSIVWTGGSQGPDRFSVAVDGITVGVSQTADSARRPSAWYRDVFTVTLGAGADHAVEIRAMDDYQSAVELAGVQLEEIGKPPYRPICYESIETLARYEAEIGSKGFVAESEHLTVFAPLALAAQARALSAFLEKAHAEMRAVYGIDPFFRFSVEHYPVGHKRGWGGISGAGTIGYTVEALERFGKLGTTDVRGFAGYTEEMSHGFKAYYKCPGTYEALGVAVQEDIVRKLVPRAVADTFWAPEHKQWEQTRKAYLSAGRKNPDVARYPNNVLYTRILNDLFLSLRTEYGPALWPDFFVAVRQMDYPLHRAKPTEALKTYADIFSVLFAKDMRPRFEEQGIDLNADPSWGWQTYADE
jgi:hypothetical protein